MYIHTKYVYTSFKALSLLTQLRLQAEPTLKVRVRYFCHIRWIYVFYVGHVDGIDYMKPFFHCNILSKHHHHQRYVRGCDYPWRDSGWLCGRGGSYMCHIIDDIYTPFQKSSED
jgi:hypothetical protein